MSRRSLFAAGIAGLAATALPDLASGQTSDPILAHITAEFVRAHKGITRNNVVRSEHLRTLAAGVRLLTIHSRTTLHLDEAVRRSVKRHPAMPVPDHNRQRQELQKHGIDPATVTMHHPDQAAWDAFVADPTPLTDRLDTVADNLDAFAATLAQQEAMNLPFGGHVVLAQGNVRQRSSADDCAVIIWNVRAADTAAAWACGVLVVPELCGMAIVLSSALWATAYFAGCT